MIRLKAESGKVFVNVRTLRYVTCNIYTKPEFEKDQRDLKQFIAEAKAQKKAEASPVETPEVKTE